MDAKHFYSENELLNLYELHCNLVKNEILNYTPGANGRLLYGLTGELEASILIRLSEDACNAGDDSLSKEVAFFALKKLGAHIAIIIKENDDQKLEQLCVILRARKKGRPLHTLTANELKISQGRGRKAKRSDLSRAFPLALIDVTQLRSQSHSGEKFTRAKITRSELLAAIQKNQIFAEMDNPPKISEGELSRWIAEYDFQSFLDEQPIARKRALKP